MRRAGRRPDPSGGTDQLDLFRLDPSAHVLQHLDNRSWPESARFPVNRASSQVAAHIRADLATSAHPLLVAGFSSIAEVIHLVAGWNNKPSGAEMRIVLGSEPFNTAQFGVRSARRVFTDEAVRYWLETRNISLRQSAQVLATVNAVKQGALRVRFVDSTSHRLHAKIYVGDTAATLGSSNFTANGLRLQLEANARFEQASDRARYEETATVAENFWEIGEDWDEEFLALLEAMLAVVSWQEALARACADLLEGQWASRYLSTVTPGGQTLWPSQRAGIAQALWIVENVGSVLVADATGSGKTRMGAHLVRAVRDRLWATGRVRGDLTTLVCPPAVKATWEQEALDTGLTLNAVSQGLLSRRGGDIPRLEHSAVQRAQTLAVDEAHNFLNAGSSRTQRIRGSEADHIMLFTATPISRGASDLLNLVGLLGPDNFDDSSLQILDRLSRRRSGEDVLSPDENDNVRRQIQRFTVRRTKSQINAMVDRDPQAFLHARTGRVCRYPDHVARTYPTGETPEDESIANQIRSIAQELRGISLLEPRLAVPSALRHLYSDDQWLHFRMAAIRGLAAHHLLDGLRSSTAALIEHVAGTAEATERFELAKFKSTDSGNVIGRLDALAERGCPEVELALELEPWMTDDDQWRAACAVERNRYELILELATRLSPARDDAKCDLLTRLSGQHNLLLAFDHHPITLALLHQRLGADIGGAKILVATGSTDKERKEVIMRFAPDATGRAVALCSDAMNEGLNLQGASCIVHLDLPTTLRVAEQRIGRVDRMDSPHEAVEAWWPRDGKAFGTRAYETLVRRVTESQTYLGKNLELPNLDTALVDAPVVPVEEQIEEFEALAAKEYDGIQDALEPVRQLTEGDQPLIPRDVYDAYRTTTRRVLARVAPLSTPRPWAFFAVAATANGAPRWMLVERDANATCIVDLSEVTARLRSHLSEDPPGQSLDEDALEWLGVSLDIAARAERQLLPQRMKRALDQMGRVLTGWADAARMRSDESAASSLLKLAELTGESDHPEVDPYLVAERWLTLVGPVFDAHRAGHRTARYVLLRDIEPHLIAEPLPLEEVLEVFTGMERATALAERVTACILGVERRS